MYKVLQAVKGSIIDDRGSDWSKNGMTIRNYYYYYYYYYYYLLQLGCYTVAVVILHVNKT